MSNNGKITEEVAKLLQNKNFVFLATLMNDGSPQITPTWVDIQNDKILINTAEGRVKHKNVSRDPRVAISVIDQSNPYNMVTIRGTVEELVAEGADEHIDKLAKKYLGMDKYPFRSPTEKRIILKIKPMKIFHQKPPR
jgi:PPOX class probable F420-dependent enzyme